MASNPEPDGLAPDSEELQEELKSLGFDLRRKAACAYLVGVGTSGAAEALRERAASDGWEGAVYVDSTGWVVRLRCVGSLRRRTLRRHARYLSRLVADGATVRGMSIEDLCPEDAWDVLAVQPNDTESERATAPDRQGVVPKQRQAPPQEYAEPVARTA